MARLAGRNMRRNADIKVAARTVSAADAVAAAGATPTKAEFDAVVTLVNELKGDHNALVTGQRQ